MNPASGASSDGALTPKVQGTRERILRAALLDYFEIFEAMRTEPPQGSVHASA